MNPKFINFIKKNKLYIILMTVFIAIFAVSAFMLIQYFAEAKDSADTFEDLQDDLSSISQVEEEKPEEKPLTPEEKYGEFYEQNDDFVGWISIEGTNLNYPVMQTVEYPNYYLDRGFDEQYSAYGVPYVDEDATIGESENLVIYGHHMKNKTMFSALDGYKDEGFYKEHKIIKFDTLSEFGEYEVIGAFKIDVINDPFHYISYLDMDEATFNSYIANVNQRAYYTTDSTAAYGDELITLSTCEYTYDESRLVVVAKKIS